jgi:hypothetical protein
MSDLERAVGAGKTLGRPRIDAATEKRIQAQLRTGKGMLKVARECGVGSGFGCCDSRDDLRATSPVRGASTEKAKRQCLGAGPLVSWVPLSKRRRSEVALDTASMTVISRHRSASE